MLAEQVKNKEFLEESINKFKKDNPSADVQFFINIASREIKYRKLINVTYEDVLKDIEMFVKNIIFRENNDNLSKVETGIRKFSNYMLENKFLIDKEALTAAAKVYYLINCIKYDKHIEKYKGNYVDIEVKKIPQQYKRRLNVIKKINVEAYYYICSALVDDN